MILAVASGKGGTGKKCEACGFRFERRHAMTEERSRNVRNAGEKSTSWRGRIHSQRIRARSCRQLGKGMLPRASRQNMLRAG